MSRGPMFGPFRVCLDVWLSQAYGVPGTPDFSPSSLSGLAGWWDVSDSNTLTLSGNDVVEMADKSGNSLTATSGPTKPDITAATINGLAALAVRNSPLSVTGLPTLTTFSMLWVVRKNSSAGENSAYGHMGFTNPVGVDNSHFGPNMQMEGVTGLTLLTRGENDGSPVYVYGVSLEASGGNAFQRLNAVTASDTGVTFGTIGNTLNIGKGDAAALDTDLGEILLYDRAISEAEMNALFDYLAAKWGVIV